jgi:hypothetical protein
LSAKITVQTVDPPRLHSPTLTPQQHVDPTVAVPHARRANLLGATEQFSAACERRLPRSWYVDGSIRIAAQASGLSCQDVLRHRPTQREVRHELPELAGGRQCLQPSSSCFSRRISDGVGPLSRESATIIAEQSRNVEQGATRSIDAMHSLKQSAIAMKQALLKGDLAEVSRTLDAGWSSKRDMARGISNPQIENALAVARAAGATAGKVSGAGGGGFIMFLAPLERRRAVMAALAEHGYRAETVRYTAGGATSWRV